MEEVRSSRRHQGNSRRESKPSGGSSTRVTGQRYSCRVTATSAASKTPSSSSSSSSSSLLTVRCSTDHRRLTPDRSLQIHSPEVDTNSKSSVETPSTNRWLAAGTEQCKSNGLVRRESDLGPIVESDKVSTLNSAGISSRDDVSTFALTRGRIQSPPAAVPCQGGATSGCVSSASQPEVGGNGQQNLRTSSSTDDRPQGAAGGPPVTSETKSSTAARPRVLALSDHITCLRQKNQRHRDDVVTSGGHVTSNSASEPAADDKCVNREW